MSLFDWIKENKITGEYEERVDEATKRFLNQRNSIRAIHDKPGYQELVRWMTVEKEAAMQAVMNSGKDRGKERGRYELADKFLTFLENLTRKN